MAYAVSPSEQNGPLAAGGGATIQVRIKRAGWIIPRDYDGLTLGRTIFIRPGVVVGRDFLAHELMHVLQWERLGFWGFVWNYGWTFVRDGFRYRNIDLEEEARNPTPEVQAWADRLLASGAVG